MKKFIISLLLIGSALAAHGASLTVTVPAAGMSNLFVLGNSPAKVTQVSAVSDATHNAIVGLMDTYTNQLGFTNAAFITTTSYATNVITTWTNYYGATNSFTNVALVDVTNTVAATTWLYPVKAAITVPTNSTIQIDNLNAGFTRGIWVTNSGNGTAIVTVTFQK